GTALLATAEEVVATRVAVTTDGNTIRNTEIAENQDLGFVSTFIGSAVPEGAEEIQLGFIALPTAMLGEAELEIGNYDNALVSIVDIPDRDTLVAEGATGYIAHITGFLQGNETDGYDYSRMGRKISGRFFVKYTLNDSEKCFYSNNDVDSPKVDAGVVSKSFVGTCKAMTTAIMNSGMAYNYTTELGSDEAIQYILDATKTDNTQKANILNFVIANATILEQLDAQ
ncbi:MAG: hypothetical protein IJE55_06925, partial [Clostridia bacterium]|nr:hypothetical protein [Clostridia bacterium]